MRRSGMAMAVVVSGAVLATLACGCSDDESVGSGGASASGGAAGTTSVGGQGGAGLVGGAGGAVPDPCPQGCLIKHGQDMPYPWFVADHVADMEQLPFDGVVITTEYSGHVQRQTPLDDAELEAELAPAASTQFTKFTHNFVMVHASNGGSYAGDYSIPSANFGKMAKAARAAGFRGIVFDNEQYGLFGETWVLGDELCAGDTLANCPAHARDAGRLAMQAMIDEWPDVLVLCFFGPWVSEPLTDDAAAQCGFPYNDWTAGNELLGPFVVGMIEASVDTQARVIDGGELYTLRSVEEFQCAHQWMKHGMPEQSSLVPPSLAADYPSLVLAGFGVYDSPWLGRDMNPSLWTETLRNALATTDRYVWAYTEIADWWGGPSGKPPVTQDWIDATAAARDPR